MTSGLVYGPRGLLQKHKNSNQHHTAVTSFDKDKKKNKWSTGETFLLPCALCGADTASYDTRWRSFTCKIHRIGRNRLSHMHTRTHIHK